MKIHRNETIFTLTPSPGPHAKSECVTLGMLLREYLGLAENRKEIKYILNNKEVLVDGRRVKSENFPLGLMDILSIPEIEKDYIISVDHKGRLYPKEIDKAHAGHKLCKLVGKTAVSGGKLQLNLYDGRNMLIDATDSKKYAVGGTLVIKLPEAKVLEFMSLEAGKTAMIAKGRHASKKGKILGISKSDLNLCSLTTVDCDGEKVVTNTEYVYIIGDKL
jgi:small subunit ribosomal protein S4e